MICDIDRKGPFMPHFICDSCGTRLYSAARPANLIDPGCPACGASFEVQRQVERRYDDGGSLSPTLAAAPGATTALELKP